MASYPQPEENSDIGLNTSELSAILRDFSQHVEYITCLETSGKIAPIEAYQQIKSLWRVVVSSRYK